MCIVMPVSVNGRGISLIGIVRIYQVSK